MRSLAFGAVAVAAAACSSFSDAPNDAGTAPDASMPTDAGGGGVEDASPDSSTSEAGPPPSSYAATVMADMPKLYYRFDDAPGATGFHDEMGGPDAHASGGSADTISIGAPGPITTDLTSSALTFSNNQNSYLDCGPGNRLGTGTGLTIELWVNTILSSSESVLVASASGATLLKGFSLKIEPGGFLQLDVGDGNTSYAFTSNATLPPQGWIHIVAAYDPSGKGTAMYVNGVGVSANGVGTVLPAAAADGTIGVGFDMQKSQSPYNGEIDELAIYTHVLDPTRVGVHFVAATSP